MRSFEILLVLLLSSACYGQIFGNTSFDANYEGVSTACGATLNAQLSCDDVLAAIAWDADYLELKQLDNLCTDSCFDSLMTARQSIVSACIVSTDVIVDSGLAYPATYVLDHLINAYQTTCRKDASSSQYCNLIFQEWLNETVIPDEAACSDCMLGTEQLALGSNVGYSDDLASEFASSTSSCGKSGYAYSTPTSFALNGTSPSSTTAPSPTCSNSYQVAAGDTCESISTAQGVSTFGLVFANSFDTGCTNFPSAGTTICLPSPCKTYVVQANDTCYSIIRKQATNATMVQLQSWNLNLNRECSNLQDYANSTICIGAPSDVADSSPTNTNAVQSTYATPAPLPTDLVAGTNTYCGKYYSTVEGDDCGLISTNNQISLKDLYFLNPEINSTCGNLYLQYSYCVAPVGDISTYANYSGSNPTGPCVSAFAPSSCYTDDIATMTSVPFMDANYTFSGSPIITNTASLPSVFPLAPDTRTDCYFYREYLSSDNTTAETQLNSCDFITYRYKSSKADLLDWNPSLTEDDCAFGQGLKYCVQLTDLTATATETSAPTSTGVAAPGPTQTGIINTCNAYVLQQTNVYCQDMADNAGITLDELYTWNPALNGDCSGLYPGYAYCVGVPDSSATTSTGTGPTSTTTTQPTSTCVGTTPPEQVQAGISCNCNKWVEQQDGIYCYDMAANAGVDLQTLYDLNPALNGDCSGLYAGYAYCLGLGTSPTPSTTTSAAQPTSTCTGGTTPPEQVQAGISCNCNSWVEQTDGIYCYDMAANAGIELQTLYDLNPALNGDCSGLYVGYAYCAGLAS